MKMRRLIALLLTAALTAGLLPLTTAEAAARESETYQLSNAYISVNVSKDNGGFAIETLEGNKLKKSDNNKRLLYHDGEYDTSFISLEIDGKDYLFGGEYGDANDPSRSGVTVSQPDGANGDITAVWSVGTLTFTEKISLANDASNYNGAVNIGLTAESSASTAAAVKARLLLDTCLGDRDYGIYQANKTGSANATAVSSETVLDGTQYNLSSLYAVDDAGDPQVAAYSLSETNAAPYQAAVGHWNSLASTLFAFTPVPTLDFTDSRNSYGTADSAAALYFDLGDVSSSGSKTLSTYYGVFSNKDKTSDSVAVNLTAPTRLALNDAKTAFVPQVTKGSADFAINVNMENVTAAELQNVTLAVRTTTNLESLTDDGAEDASSSFGQGAVRTISYASILAGQTIQKALYFKAQKTNDAAYERVTVAVYSAADLTDEHLLGQESVYILLPGADGDIPSMSFTSMTPNTVYESGTRHLYVTLTNATLLGDRGKWALKAVAADGTVIEIPQDGVTVNDTTGVMDVVLPDSLKLAVGSWQLRLDWTDSAVSGNIIAAKYQHQTADILHFTVSEDVKYKNDTYGVAAVVRYDGKNSSTGVPTYTYRIMTFRDEAAFADFQTTYAPSGSSGDPYGEILLVFRGELVVEKTYNDASGKAQPTKITAVSEKGADGKYKPVTINGCLDFEAGTMSVYYEEQKLNPFGSAVCTEFDGHLYTSNARSSVWKGKAILTKLKQDSKYTLLTYNSDGVRQKTDGSTMKLIWPSVLGTAQTIAGMIFNLAFGEFGKMMKTDEQGNTVEAGRVLSFSASLNLSFSGGLKEGGQPKDSVWSKYTSFWKFYNEGNSLYTYCYGGAPVDKVVDWSTIDESPNPDSKSVSGSVMVRDILYGCGKGFVGVNFTANIAIQNYIDGLPKVTGTLKVNTIGNWSFGLDGSMKMETFSVSASLSFKSKNNVPVPDSLQFFIGGFEPGINVDGCTVLWITGGGGGFSNLYDTIFCKSGVPPLKLILSVGFSIEQVLEGTATVSLGATGLSLSGKDLKVEGLDQVLIPKAQFSLEWYPGIDMKASISVDLMGFVKGGGYIVLTSKDYKNYFFEAFARSKICIPGSVPLVGGMEITGVDLGISSKKVWGAMKIVDITLGLTYYWGAGDVDFGTGNGAKPTYPELLGSVVPLGYSEEKQQELYARVGTNVSLLSEAEIGEDPTGTVRLQSAGPYLKSNGTQTTHVFNLGTYSAASQAAIIQFSYTAQSQAEALSLAKQFTVKDKSGTAYALTFYDAGLGNGATCNANVSWDETSKTAAFAFTMKESCYGQEWTVSSPAAAAGLLYNVAAVPEVTGVTGAAAAAGSTMNVTWTGSDLDQLDSLSFYLTPKNDGSTAGYSLGKLTTGLGGKSAVLDVPADIPAGEYYLCCIYSKDDEVNSQVYSSRLTIANANTPAAAGTPAVSAAGDLKLSVTVPQTSDAKTVGYEATVYKTDGTTLTATEVNGIRYDRAASGDTVFEIGGTYKDASGNSAGLAADTAYAVGVTPYYLDGGTIVYGAESFSGAITLPAPATPAVSISANASKTVLSRTAGSGTQDWDTYTTQSILFTVSADQKVTGIWTLDGSDSSGCEGKFTDASDVAIPFAGLADGDHTLLISGTNAAGDGFALTYAFTVDTTPPRLLLSSPANGSVFNENGTLTITGVTDADARFFVACDGVSVCSGKTVSQLGGTIDTDGVFSFTVDLADPNSSCTHSVTIRASDAAGNIVSQSASVTHGGLGDLASLDIQSNGLTIQNGNIAIGASGLSAQLRMIGRTSTGVEFVLDNGNVNWLCSSVSGTASVDDSGKLTASAGAQGVVTAQYQVTNGAYRTASMSFGARNGRGLVSTSSTLGGTVTGGGYYNPGDTVTLTAVPNAGYSFTGWKLTGVTVSNTSAAAITFKMPSSGDVTATADFKTTQNGGGKVLSGRILTADLPDGADPAQYIPYYYGDSGEKIYVSFSAAVDGKLLYLDPGKTCSFEKRSVTFTDIATHWGREDVEFAASRSIVDGVGGGLFDPNGTMTRAMFVTVLWRIAGCPAVSGGSAFTDVPAGQWYTSAVAWASVNGIVDGYGGGRFGPSDPITREQLCAVILRFVQWSGLSLKAVKAAVTFADAAKIDTWAASAVSQCQTAGLVDGKNGNVFDPLGYATRAEACAILHRMIVSLLGANA